MNAWQALQVKADSPQGQVLAAGTPAIAMLNYGTGSIEIGVTIFMKVIVGILKFYGAEWELDQIRETAEIMHHEYYWLHLAELKQFSIRAKAGTYNVKRSAGTKGGDGFSHQEFDGKVYGKLSPAVLMKWIAEYAGESIEARSMMNWDAKPAAPIEAPGTVDVAERLTAFVLENFGDSGLSSQEQDEAYREAKIMQAQKNAIRQKQHEDQLKKQQP